VGPEEATGLGPLEYLETTPRTKAVLRDANGQPVAGEIAAAPMEPPLPWIAFVRDNCVVSVSLPDRAALEGEARERFIALLRGLDRLLMAAPGREVKDEWLPTAKAVLVELPSPVAGRPFALEARVNLHGRPCPTGRLAVDWRLTPMGAAPGATTEPVLLERLGPTRVCCTVDQAQWWTVTCEVSYDGSPVQSRQILLWVSPDRTSGRL